MKLSAFIRSLLLFVVTSLIASCAGGTRGTGGVEYRGRIITADNAPLEDVQVTLVDSGATARSTADGSFVIESNSTGEPLFLFQRTDFSVQLSVKNVPDDAHVVEVEFEINTDDDTGSVRTVDVKERRHVDEDSDDRSDDSNEIDQHDGNDDSSSSSDDSADEDDSRGSNSGHNDESSDANSHESDDGVDDHSNDSQSDGHGSGSSEDDNSDGSEDGHGGSGEDNSGQDDNRDSGSDSNSGGSGHGGRG